MGRRGSRKLRDTRNLSAALSLPTSRSGSPASGCGCHGGAAHCPGSSNATGRGTGIAAGAEEGALVGVAVEVEGLTMPSASQTIGSDVTLTLPPGEISVLLGPSGPGKSVFLKS